MSLELGSRFRLTDGRLVEVVPDVKEILGMTTDISKCVRCAAVALSDDQCNWLGCKWEYKGDYSWENTLSVGYPRILKEVEDEP